MGTRSSTSKEGILDAAQAVIQRRGAPALTIDAVAKEAGCAKGLIHYHLKNKKALLEAVADRLAEQRERDWREAFHTPSANEAIAKSWTLLTREAQDGTVRAWTSLVGSGVLTEQTAKKAVTRYSRALGEAAIRLLRDLKLEPAVPVGDLGWLLAATVEGLGLQLVSGVDGKVLEEAYAAAWLGVLSLGGPSG